MKRSKAKLITASLICAALGISYLAGGGPAGDGFFSGNRASLKSPESAASDSVSPKSDSETAGKGEAGTEEPALQEKDETAQSTAESKGADQDKKNAAMTSDVQKDKYQTNPIPEGKPDPVEPQAQVITDKKLSCTLSVRCDTVLQNMGILNPGKKELIPPDGNVFSTAKVDFYEGETVFDVLLRSMKENKIHMEFVNTPIYNSAYIEGINNLYEFDAGELSGWMYKVNGWFPNYGCSRYQLEDGDVVEWVYTCDLGRDVGGSQAEENSAQGGAEDPAKGSAEDPAKGSAEDPAGDSGGGG